MTHSHTDKKTGVVVSYFVDKKEPVTWVHWIGNRRIVMRDGKIISDEIFPEGEAKLSSLTKK